MSLYTISRGSTNFTIFLNGNHAIFWSKISLYDVYICFGELTTFSVSSSGVYIEPELCNFPLNVLPSFRSMTHIKLKKIRTSDVDVQSSVIQLFFTSIVHNYWKIH